MDFTCKRCGHSFSTKSNYLVHLRRKSPCKVTLEDIDPQAIIAELLPPPQQTRFICDYCHKCFSSRQNRWRHIQDCEKHIDHHILINKESSNNDMIRQLLTKVDELQKYIHSQNQHVGTNNINANNVNIQQNIITLPSQTDKKSFLKEFGCENMEAIPDDLVSSCFMFLKYRELLENLHCDPNYPENHNIRIKSVKRNMMEIYKNKKWNVVTLNEGLTELIQQGTRIFQMYARKNEDKIIEEDMSQAELAELMSKLQELDAMNKTYIVPLSKDIQAMLETYKAAPNSIIPS